MFKTAREAPIRLLAMDVDGVLTDGKIIISSSGDEVKQFHVADGMGIFLARKAGLVVAIITGRSSLAVEKRARELGIVDLHQDVSAKGEVLQGIMTKYGLEAHETAYIGDDVNDLPAFAIAGLKIAVANADDQLKQRADFITDRRGGEGAVREVINHILKKKGLLDKMIQQLVEG